MRCWVPNKIYQWSFYVHRSRPDLRVTKQRNEQFRGRENLRAFSDRPTSKRRLVVGPGGFLSHALGAKRSGETKTLPLFTQCARTKIL
jgi:hypothetical protein